MREVHRIIGLLALVIPSYHRYWQRAWRLQLVPSSSTFQIRHAHDFNHQTCPSSEMLRALSLPGLRVVLLPSKPSFLPAFVYSLDQILAEVDVELFCPGLVSSLLLSNILVAVSLTLPKEKTPQNLQVAA